MCVVDNAVERAYRICTEKIGSFTISFLSQIVFFLGVVCPFPNVTLAIEDDNEIVSCIICWQEGEVVVNEVRIIMTVR